MTRQTLLDRYQPHLEALLTPPRLQHCLGVMQVMEQLAPLYRLDLTQAMLAGLLHDAAKDKSPQEQLDLALPAKITFTCSCERLPVYLHAPLGAYVAHTEFGIHDTAILDAIATHSYAGDWAKVDTTLAWCLRIADILAPVTPWPGMRKLHSTMLSGQLIETKLLHAHWVCELFVEWGTPLHPNLARFDHELSAQLEPDAAFFHRW